MSRHSKNACAAPIFSYAERQRLKYGTQSRRVGLDAQKQFDACNLCLQKADQPVICPRGHVLCRRCMIEGLARQKEEGRAARAAWEEAHKQANKVESEKKAKEEEEAIKRFKEREAMVSLGSDSAVGTNNGSSAPAGYIKVSSSGGSGTAYVVDREKVRALNTPAALQAAASAVANAPAGSGISTDARRSFMPSFWLPSMAPSDVSEESKAAQLRRLAEPPPAHTLCPGSDHVVRLKHFKPIHWYTGREAAAAMKASSSEQKESTAAAAVSSPSAPHCFSCQRQLTNLVPMIAILKCGHVLCKHCVETLMKGKKDKKGTTTSTLNHTNKADTAAHSTTPSSSLICLQCDDPCQPSDLVSVVATTGFAATGNKIATATLTPAFQC